MAAPEPEARDDGDEPEKTVAESIKDGINDAIEGNVASKEEMREAFSSE